MCVNRNVFILNMEITKKLTFFFNLTEEPNFLAQLCSLWARRGSPLHPFVACQIITLLVSHKYFVRMGWLLCVISNLCFVFVCNVCVFVCLGGFHLTWRGRESHPFGENGQEILPSCKEPWRTTFLLFV